MNTIAPVSSTAASRPSRLLGDSGLTVGQVVHARVARVDGDVVQLRLGDQTVSVTSRVPLDVGQQVSLMVEEGSAGKMLLRMVDDTFGKGSPSRTDGGAPSRTGGTGTAGQTTGAGRQLPVLGVTGRPDQEADGSPGGQSSGQSGSGSGGAGGGRLIAEVLANAGAFGAALDGELLATLLLQRPSSAAGKLAGGTLADLAAGQTPGRLSDGGAGTDGATGLVARAALPTYGRLAQSVGGSVAFGQLMATLGQDVGLTLARAPLAPSDLGKLLIEMGVHPDEMNAALVAELLAQGEGVSEAGVRSLRRELAGAGGTPRDAAAAVALSRLGLPVTPLSLGVARQMLAGQFDPRTAWGDLLPDLQQLARYAGSSSQAGTLAAELLADWRVPLRAGAGGIEQWLRTTVDQVATPLEAKLTRAASGTVPDSGQQASPGQDVRARLDLLAQSLPASRWSDRSMLGQSLQRIQATVQSEQMLNGSKSERTEQRYFSITVPSLVDQRPSTLQIRVRERDAQPRKPGEAGRPDVVQLKLSLPGLGDLGVNLTIGQHSVGCHFSAATPFAEALLSAGAGDLADKLKGLGYAYAAVDAAHEPVAPLAPMPAAARRMSHVDLKA